jgi:hypothetical protein
LGEKYLQPFAVFTVCPDQSGPIPAADGRRQSLKRRHGAGFGSAFLLNPGTIPGIGSIPLVMIMFRKKNCGIRVCQKYVQESERIFDKPYIGVYRADGDPVICTFLYGASSRRCSCAKF